MIVASGRVVAIDEQDVLVETVRQSTCGSCSARRGCGHGLLAMAGARQGATEQVATGQSVGASAGHELSSLVRVERGNGAADVRLHDQVQIAIAERALVAGVAWVYLLPLLLMMLALTVGSRWGDAAAALAALAGLLGGFGLLRWHARHLARMPAYLPVIVAVQSAGAAMIEPPHCP